MPQELNYGSPSGHARIQRPKDFERYRLLSPVDARVIIGSGEGMSTGPVRTNSVCPKCGKALRLRSLQDSLCVACNEPVRISWSYRRQVAYMALVIDAVVGLATYDQTSAGPWIIGLVLLWVLIAFALQMLVPATYEPGYPQEYRLTFVVAFISTFLSILLVEFVGFLTLFFVVGAKPADVQEQLDTLSVPLVWFSHQFRITPQKNFLDVCGIMLGNSFLLGIPLYVCGKVVHFFLRRNRVVQIGIDGSVDLTDDND
jgi:hypothetical protein